jgi:Flp pilus assembly protein TadD
MSAKRARAPNQREGQRRRTEPAAPRPKELAAGRTRWRKFLPLLVVAAGLAAYYNCFDGEFLLDDRQNIIENEVIRELTPLGELLTHRRRPLVNLTLGINYAIGELEPWGYHAFNLGVHLLAALALYGVVRRTLLTERMRPRFGHAAHWYALAVSLLWVVHPLTTQSVTYIVQRAESMMGLFYLLTLYCVVRAVDSPRRAWWHLGAVIACFLGMGSKAVMVTAPMTVLLFDVVFLAGSPRRALQYRWPLYLGLAATWGVLVATGVVGGVLFPPPDATSLVGFGYKGLTPWAYLLTQSEVILHYIRLSVWPHPLCLDYGWRTIRNISEVAVPVLAIFLLLGCTVWALVRRWWVGFAAAWFFIILAPTSSFIPIKDVAFEHRMYLPLAGVIALCVGCAQRLLTWALDRADRSSARPIVAGCLLAVVTVALGLTTARRNLDYHDDVTMWRDVVEKQPGHVRGRYNLGVFLFDDKRYSEAEAQFRAVLKLNPNHVMAHNNLGNCLMKTGRLEESLDEFKRTIELDPNHWRGQHSLGSTLARLGRFKEALPHLQAAVRLNPDYAAGFYNLGNVYRDLNRYDEAVKAYSEAIEADPKYTSAYKNRGIILRHWGRLREAIADFETVLRLNPDDKNIRKQLDATKRQLSAPATHR